MRAPANRPGAILWAVLLVPALGTMITIGQAVYVGMWRLTPPLVAAFVAAAALAVFVSIRIARVGREMKAWAIGDHPMAREDVARHMGPVLAQWTFTREEWAAYAEHELRHRRGQAPVFAATAALVGFGAMGARGAPFWMAVVSGVVMGVAGWWSWLGWNRHKHAQNLAVREPSVTIAANAVLFSGLRQHLGDRYARIAAVRFLQAERPPILAIHITFPHSRITTSFDLRVPVPRGREGEARALEESFAAGTWGVARFPAGAS
ncbi:MAG TPA: hypothetical protein VF541_04825 [Longimicrobium sp.]|jgi:hypothetical protein